MFSVTFALIAILAIAVTNLFLGFATAMLLGRGPKNWSDLDQAVTVRYFAPRLLFPGAQRHAAPPLAPPLPIEPIAPTPSVRSMPEASEPAALPEHPVVNEPVPVSSPSQCAAWDSTVKKLVLAPRPTASPDDTRTPDEIFAGQWEKWRAHPGPEAHPCLAGVLVAVRGGTLDADARSALMKAVQTSITGQLRKDRRVLRVADDQCMWFLPDVSTADALAPVERTRQMLRKTRFVFEEQTLDVAVQSAVVAVSAADDPPLLIQRLQQTLHFALERGENATCTDTGQGPTVVPGPDLDLEEIECVVA